MASPLTLLHGYELVLACPDCHISQTMGDDTVPLDQGEHISLHAAEGRYILNYRVRCWTCNATYEGSLTVRSRSAAVDYRTTRAITGQLAADLSAIDHDDALANISP